jgi:hypothetical protein
MGHEALLIDIDVMSHTGYAVPLPCRFQRIGDGGCAVQWFENNTVGNL